MKKSTKSEKSVKEKKEIDRDVENQEKSNKEKVIEIIKELLPYVIILIVVVVIRTFFFTPIMVNGPSMNPTLDGGEIMILNKRSKIERFNIVVVDTGSDVIIKRVIALPGEKIKCEDNKVYVNYHLQEEDYSQGNTCMSNEFEYSLGDDEYFVMGDNRGNSADSRNIGPVKREQIKGTTNFILYPFNKFGKVK